MPEQDISRMLSFEAVRLRGASKSELGRRKPWTFSEILKDKIVVGGFDPAAIRKPSQS